jgi:large subunit ribosomal protein L10
MGGEKMARPEKEALVAEVSKKFSKSQAVVLTDFRGLTVQEVTELRKQLREAGVEMKVVKNTLTRLAAQKSEIEGLDAFLEGPIALAFGYEDPIAPAKILAEFAKKHKKMELKGGVLEGKVIDQETVMALADLPTKEVLLGQLAGVLQAPIRNLVNVLSAPIRNTVYALEAIRKKQAGEA